MKRSPFLFSATLALGLACGPSAPKKPAGVASEAFWVGDRHQGVFVYQGLPDHEGWQMKIYDDHTGTVLSEGLFVIQKGLARPEIRQEEIASWDGKVLRMKDGATVGLKTPH